MNTIESPTPFSKPTYAEHTPWAVSKLIINVLTGEPLDDIGTFFRSTKAEMLERLSRQPVVKGWDFWKVAELLSVAEEFGIALRTTDEDGEPVWTYQARPAFFFQAYSVLALRQRVAEVEQLIAELNTSDDEIRQDGYFKLDALRMELRQLESAEAWSALF